MPRLPNRNFLLKSSRFNLALGLVAAFWILAFAPMSASATPPANCPGGPAGSTAPTGCPYSQSEVNGFCADFNTIPASTFIYCPDDNGDLVQQANPLAPPIDEPPPAGKCGGGDDAVDFTFDIGCRGEGNPILDILFAVIRFLTYTVGIVLVGAMIITGIQHTLSRENPEATKHTVERLLWIGVALLIYVFAFAILNFLVPGGLLT